MAKKKEAEIIHPKKENRSINLLKAVKITIAVFMDVLDMFFANIPGINSLWDFITLAVLLLIMKDKKLALVSFTEIVFPGFPFLGQIDAFIPVATILVILDNRSENFKKNFRKSTWFFGRMKKVN